MMVALAGGVVSASSPAWARQPRPDPEPGYREIGYIPYEIVVFPHDPFDSAAIADRMKEDGFLILGRGAMSGLILAATAPVPGIEEVMCGYMRMWPEVRAAVRNAAGEPLGRQPGDVCPPGGTYTSDHCGEPFAGGHIKTNCCTTSLPPGHPNDPTFCYQWGLHNTGQSVVDLSRVPIEPNPTGEFCWEQEGIAGIDINLLAAWERETGDSRVTVAVFDSGIEDCNPDFDPDRFLPSDLAYTCEGNNSYSYPCCLISDPCDYGEPVDHYGHGTFVASIIGAVADNGIGMTGIDQGCKLMAARDFDPDGFAPLSVGYARVIMAFEEIYSDPGYESVRVINCSFLLPYEADHVVITPLFDALEVAINDCVAQHRFVVAGSGNSGSAENSAIQRLPNVFTVGGIDARGWRFDHPHSTAESSTGPSLDFMAPGMAEIGLTAQVGGCMPTTPPQPSCPYRMYASEFAVKHNYQIGTSYAAPKVCGAISLILAKAIECGIVVAEENDWSALPFEEMYEIIKAGCRDRVSWEQYPLVEGDPLDDTGKDDYYGWGLIDIDASLEYLENNYCNP